MPETSHAAPLCDAGIPRRSLVMTTAVGALGVGYATVIGYPVYRYLATPVRRAAIASQVREIAIPLKDLPPKGAALHFKFGFQPALLIHHEDDSLSCFSAVCTHLGCTVAYERDKTRIHCACHGGIYDPRTGEVRGGPPPKALTRYQVETKDDQIVVTRV